MRAPPGTERISIIPVKTVYVNGKFLAQPITGVQRYARSVVAAWDDALEEGRIDRSRFCITIVAPRDAATEPGYRHIPIILCRSTGKLFEQVELPARTCGNLLFSPYAAAPILKWRHVVTIHDAGVASTPEQYSRQFRTFYSLVYRSLGLSCRRIFTDSEFSKQELQHHFSIPTKKLKVVYPGCDHLIGEAPDFAILKRFSLEPGAFILGVSSRSAIKNFEGLASSWKLLDRQDIKLAIAGKSNTRIFGAKSGRQDDGITWLGYVSDGELRALYQSAAVFVYPSFYEGFGYPPLEAMSCGCPVVVADKSALPESCGDAALYCDPSSPGNIAENVRRLLDDAQLSEDLRTKGKHRAEQFSTRKTGTLLWEEIESHL